MMSFNSLHPKKKFEDFEDGFKKLKSSLKKSIFIKTAKLYGFGDKIKFQSHHLFQN